MLPAVGSLGVYTMPPIISGGIQLAPEIRYPVEVVAHIGAFGLRLKEIRRPRFFIETHFSSFCHE